MMDRAGAPPLPATFLEALLVWLCWGADPGDGRSRIDFLISAAGFMIILAISRGWLSGTEKRARPSVPSTNRLACSA